LIADVSKVTEELHVPLAPDEEISNNLSEPATVSAVKPEAETLVFEVYHANVVETAVVATAARAAQDRINLFLNYIIRVILYTYAYYRGE